MTKKKEPQIWLDRIARAKKVKQYWRDKFKIDLAYEYWEGNQRPANVPVNEWITVNKIYSTLVAELPNLYAQNPEFYVKLKQSFNVAPEAVALYDQKSKIRQAMLNYLRDELDLKNKSRMAILDAQFQFGVIKLSHQVDFLTNPNAGQPVLGTNGEPLIDEEGKEFIEPKKIPTNGRFVIERLHPDDYIVDEDANPLHFTWCAHKIKRRLEEIQKDKRYNVAAINKLQPTEISAEDKDRETRKKGNKVFDTDKEPKPDIVVLWEIWQPEKKEFLVVSEGCQDEFLLAPSPFPPGIEEHPFVNLRFVMRDDSWYPYPPVFPKLDPQREISETRSKILAHRKRFNRKYTLFHAGFDNAEMAAAKLESGEDGTVLITSQPGDMVRPINDAPLDMQVHTELVYLDRDFQEYGAGASQRGSGTGIDSATEAGIIERNYQVRQADKQAMVSEFLTEIGRKLDQLVQANLTQEMAIRVRGPEGEAWELVRPQDYGDIMGEYGTGVVLGSHTPQLPEIERAQALNFFSLVAQAPQMAMSPALMNYIGRLFNIHETELALMIQELQRVFQMMQQAAMMAKTGGTGIGSMPNVAENSRVQSAMPGMAMGMNNIRGGQQ